MEEQGRGRGIREVIVWALLLVVPLAWIIFVLPQSLTSVGVDLSRAPFFGPSKARPVKHE